MDWYFTADEHYGHASIIKYCNRPFDNVQEMDRALIANHNSTVERSDTVVHAGDFTLGNRKQAAEYIKQLNGNHIFLQGSHDRWLNGCRQIWERTIDNQFIVVCHYTMRTWARSHYNSWQLHGHSHGKLQSYGKRLDIGVDSHDFRPISFDRIKYLMGKQGDNFNYIGD